MGELRCVGFSGIPLKSAQRHCSLHHNKPLKTVTPCGYLLSIKFVHGDGTSSEFGTNTITFSIQNTDNCVHAYILTYIFVISQFVGTSFFANRTFVHQWFSFKSSIFQILKSFLFL